MYKTHSTHVCCELIHLVKRSFFYHQCFTAIFFGTKIEKHKLIGRIRRPFVLLYICTPYPESFFFQFFYQMPSNKTTGAAN